MVTGPTTGTIRLMVVMVTDGHISRVGTTTTGAVGATIGIMTVGAVPVGIMTVGAGPVGAMTVGAVPVGPMVVCSGQTVSAGSTVVVLTSLMAAGSAADSTVAVSTAAVSMAVVFMAVDFMAVEFMAAAMVVDFMAAVTAKHGVGQHGRTADCVAFGVSDMSLSET